MARPKIPIRQRLDATSTDIPSGCRLWLGCEGRGYGRINVDGKLRAAHQVAFELAEGLVPDGLVLDHLCRNRRCINPDHLEPVTFRENILRGAGFAAVNAKKTHCARSGHSLSGQNLYISPVGKRECRECRRAASRRMEQRRRGHRTLGMEA